MDHAEIRELILVYEDLTEEERRLADRHLDECAPCRRLLDRLQEAECVATEESRVPAVSLPDDPQGLVELDAGERAAADESLRLLLRQRPRAASGRRFPWPVGLGVLAAAAALVLMVWTPWNVELTITDLRVTPAGVIRGAGNEPVADAVTLRFVQEVDGWPVVVRLRSGQEPQLLLPAADWPGLRLTAGRPVVLPPAGSGRIWDAPPQGQKDVYLVAISRNAAPSFTVLQDLLAAAGDPGNVRESLAARFGSVAEAKTE